MTKEYKMREYSIKWERELFPSNLLRGNSHTFRLCKALVVETFRRSVDVVLVVVVWGALVVGLLTNLGSPGWTSAIFAFLFVVFGFVYTSTSRIRDIAQIGALAHGLSHSSKLGADEDFIELLGKRVEWTTVINQALEILWGVGLIALLPMMIWFFGFALGLIAAGSTLLIAFLFFMFVTRTSPSLFRMALAEESRHKQWLFDKFMSKTKTNREG